MSENNRERALAAALEVANNGTSTSEILGRANAFLAFLNGDKALDAPKDAAPTSASQKTTTSPAPATKASQPKAAKPASGPSSTDSEKPATPSKPAPTATEEQVGKVIGAMLEANKKVEAIALLGKFGAKSKSTLAEEHYAAFVAGAEEILLS